MAWLADMMNIYSYLQSQRQVWVLTVFENQVTSPMMSLYRIPSILGKFA